MLLLSFLRCLVLASVSAARPHSPLAAFLTPRQSEGCTNADLPASFTVTNFAARSADGGQSLTSFTFGLAEETNDIATQCHFNASSVNVGPPDRTPRYACENSIMRFIYGEGILTIIEGVCPQPDGTFPFTASGGTEIHVECGAGDHGVDILPGEEGELCMPDSTELTGNFFSLNPTRPGVDDKIEGNA